MAIQKAKTLSNGASGNYWKVTSESYDKMTFKCTWTISLFTDKAHSDAELPSLGFSKIYTYISNKTELMGNRTALAYTQIQAQASAMVVPFGGKASDSKVIADSDLAGGTLV